MDYFEDVTMNVCPEDIEDCYVGEIPFQESDTQSPNEENSNSKKPVRARAKASSNSEDEGTQVDDIDETDGITHDNIDESEAGEHLEENSED